MAEEGPKQGARSFTGIDIIKAIATLLVVAIHCSPFGMQYPNADFFLVQGVSRVAVPVFFMATGYFYAGALVRKTRKVAFSGYLYRIVVLYMLWTLLYIPHEILVRDFSSASAITKSVAQLGRNLVFCGSYFHLWYFPALVSCLMIHHLLSRFLSHKWILVVAAIFYGLSCLGDSYYEISRIAPFSAFVDLWRAAFVSTRNLFLNGLLFLMLGIGLYGAKDSSKARPFVSLLFSVLFLGLYRIEGYCLESFHISRDHNVGLFLVPAAYCLFLTAKNWNPNLRTEALRGISVVVFCVHPFVMLLIGPLGFSPAMSYLGVVLVSSLLGWFIVARNSPPIKLLY